MLAIIYLKNGEIGEGGEEREILRAFKSLKKIKIYEIHFVEYLFLRLQECIIEQCITFAREDGK